MLVLAFDTCLDKMYVTLVRDGVTLKSVAISYEGMQTRSPKLLEKIKDALVENALNFADLDLIATSVGPGGFYRNKNLYDRCSCYGTRIGEKTYWSYFF